MEASFLFFAPMEGITDGVFRKAIRVIFPEWKYLSTDFFRIPPHEVVREKKIIEHFGCNLYEDPIEREKTIFQILVSPSSAIVSFVRSLEGLGIRRLDLNLGCPSKRVNFHRGGAYLLSVPGELKTVVQKIRKNFGGIFTVKMRTGYHNTDSFEECLKILEGEGVEGITIHGRTRDELYRGRADWSYIKKATLQLSLPVIGNGDVWDEEDVDRMLEQTACYGVMVGRGALKTPWLAKLYEYRKLGIIFSKEKKLRLRRVWIKRYFKELELGYREQERGDDKILRRFKALSRYLFDDFNQGVALRQKLFRSKKLPSFHSVLHNLEEYL